MTSFNQEPRVITEVPKAIEEVLENQPAGTSRRAFLKTSGALVVSFGASGVMGVDALTAAVGGLDAPLRAGPYPDPDFRQLDSWVAIHADNTATFYVGKTDCGQGTGTAFRQMMSDELDIAYDDTSLVMGSTDVTPDQGGSGGSDGIQTDGWPMRPVAAEARRVLLEMASERLNVPVEQLDVREAVITLRSDPSRSVTYGELIGDRRFNVPLTGRNVNAVAGVAEVKPVVRRAGSRRSLAGSSPRVRFRSQPRSPISTTTSNCQTKCLVASMPTWPRSPTQPASSASTSSLSSSPGQR